MSKTKIPMLKDYGEVKFNATPAEFELIGKVVDKICEIVKRMDFDAPDRLKVTMDLTACHSNAVPLDLARLLKASDADILHDVVGIMNHIDRSTGKLLDHFRPRYAKKGAR